MVQQIAFQLLLAEIVAISEKLHQLDSELLVMAQLRA